jgi:hypothetical protein
MSKKGLCLNMQRSFVLFFRSTLPLRAINREAMKPLIDHLAHITPREYLLQPLPSDTDVTIERLVDMFINNSSYENEQIVTPRTTTISWHLIAYATRMASLAVRLNSEEPIFKGLIALFIEGFTLDRRESLQVLCLLYNSCRRLNVNADALFTRASQYVSQEIKIELLNYVHRPASDKTLSSMGFEEGSDADGFKYQRSW